MRQRLTMTAIALGVVAISGAFAWIGQSDGYANTHQRPAANEGPVLAVLEIYNRSDEGESRLHSDYNEFEATAYCVSGITYSGVAVRRGIVAADPEILPIGSVIEIQAGDYSGVYTVMDTGAVIKGRLIDIYMPEYEEAIQFGRQQVRVRIIRHGWQPGPSLPSGYTVAG